MITPACPNCKCRGSVRSAGGSTPSRWSGATDVDVDYRVQCQECDHTWFSQHFTPDGEEELAENE